MLMATKREMAKVLRATARELEKHGWCKGSYTDNQGRHCVIGAAIHTCTGLGYDNLRPFVVRMNLSKFIGLRNRHVEAWNDHPNRRVEDVLKALRGCARNLEHGGKLYV
jgi:hypothetical protein